MKFYKLGLLTLLISLFILNGCKNPDGLGLGVDPENQLNGTLMVDTSLVANTVYEDSVVTSGITAAPLSYFKDPDFGTTEANIAILPTLPKNTSSYTVPTGTITIDSARLIIPYAVGFYGDSLTSQYKLDVHQLKNPYPYRQAIYNTTAWQAEPSLVGTKTFYARPHDTIRIYNIIDDKPDTLIRVNPQLRIPISNAFINSNLFNASSTVRSSAALFQNNIKGLYLTLDPAATTGPGGNLLLRADSANITVYYRVTNGTTIDTSSVTLPCLTQAAQIKHDYSDRVKAAIAGTLTDGLLYLAGPAGTRVKLNFPNIKNMFAGVGSDVIINRAELVVKVAPGTTTPYAPIRRLTLYKYNLAKQRVVIQDVSPTDPRATGFSGYYNAATGEYHILVTSFIQDLYRNKTVDYGTYLAATVPDNVTTVGIDVAPSVAQRTIAIGKNSPDRIKLNIIYTKIK